MGNGPAAEWALLGAAGAVSCLAATVVLQAVDGIALKAMVDLWAAHSTPDKAVLFQAALSVRQIEIGLAGITTHEDRMSSDLGKEGGYEETNNADHVVAARPRGLRVLCDAARAHKFYYYQCEARSGLSTSIRNWWHT